MSFAAHELNVMSSQAHPVVIIDYGGERLGVPLSQQINIVGVQAQPFINSVCDSYIIVKK